MNKIMRWAKQFKTPRAAMMSMAFLMTTSLFAKTDHATFKNDDASLLTVPELNEWRDMDLSDAKIVTPKKVANGLVKPYNVAKVQHIIDLVLHYDKFDAYYEEASLKTGVPAIYLKIKDAAESSLKENAKSPTGPVGICQFTRATGRYVGLRIDQQVDERRIPERAIEAGAIYTAHNLGRAKGNFFTTVVGGKNVYGAMARYYGIVKSGDWKQYEANLAAVFDYFGLSHTVDMDRIVTVKQNHKISKLEVTNAEEFASTIAAEKEAQKKSLFAPVPDVNPEFGLALFKGTVQERLLEQVQAHTIVMDNIVSRKQIPEIVEYERIFSATSINRDSPLQKALKEMSAAHQAALRLTENKDIFDLYTPKNKVAIPFAEQQPVLQPGMSQGMPQGVAQGLPPATLSALSKMFGHNSSTMDLKFTYTVNPERKSPFIQQLVLSSR